ncbi:hypothetical protein A6V39_05005 [Candidatus Mycoplasma haematobovis]|uniref:Uncharacterized protein n=1 Tax=Candidatus Mycoplasma haematobovis TaxID=432608 RepID=A0A1A9QCU6_9MOLU|nr:hypothetical protein [Candidatus Mycoplasma haematobovis]OAL09786.1 hypothetical protein A6V39_05005 [Candidatus Mycoplasma haematobovis]
MPSLLTNISIGVGGLAVAGGVAYGGYEVFKDKTQSITELLKKNNKTLLTDQSGDASAWNTNWGKYIDTNSAGESAKTPKETDIWGLSDWSTQKNTRNTAPNSFKKECGIRATKRVISDKDEAYKEVENYCSK